MLHWWHPPAGPRHAHALLRRPAVAAVRHRASTSAPPATAACSTSGRLPRRRARSSRARTRRISRRRRPARRRDVYEHCCRAIDRSLTAAPRLPLMGTGDWNDGMNRVGREGRGESVWLGFFLVSTVLGGFHPALRAARGDASARDVTAAHRADADARARRRGLGRRLVSARLLRRRHAARLGAEQPSAASTRWRRPGRCISGAAPPSGRRRRWTRSRRELVAARGRADPPAHAAVRHEPHDPGYIKGYVPGIRENGGQYTHAAIWAVRAMAELGRRDRARAPARDAEAGRAHARHARSGRGLSGGALRRRRRHLRRRRRTSAAAAGAGTRAPRAGCIVSRSSRCSACASRAARRCGCGPASPTTGPASRCGYRLPDGSTWTIEVRNPDGCAEAVRAVWIDDAAGTVERRARHGMALVADGRAHRVTVTLGRRA